MYIYTHIYMYICIYVYVYICIYVYDYAEECSCTYIYTVLYSSIL